MDKLKAEEVLSNPDSTPEDLLIAQQVLVEMAENEGSQTPPAPGSDPEATLPPTPPTPSASVETDADQPQPSAPAHVIFTRDSEIHGIDELLALCQQRMEVLPHADRNHVQEIHDLFKADNDRSLDLGDETPLDVRIAEAERIESRTKYLLRQLQGDEGFLTAIFARLFRA